jgi:hypothetical protein
MIGSYFCSWSSKWVYTKDELDIKDVESDIIYISFAKPDCSYTKGSFEGTGLSFSSDFQVVAGAIQQLPETKTVMLSVGGGTYGEWDQLNVDAIIALADDLHCKGIDIDWEPINGAQSADQMAVIIDEFRSNYAGYLSFATAHVGAYGHGNYTSSQPVSMYTGVNYPGLIKSGHKLDWINVMAYDAGITFDPLEAFDAYKAIFPKKIYMGVEIGDQAWGGVITSLDDVQKLYDHIKDKGGDLFVWSWLKPGPFTYQEMVKKITPTPPEKRPIEQVDTPEVQPDKSKDTTPELIIPEQTFEPKLPTIEKDDNKVMWTPGKKLESKELVFYNNATYKVLATHVANQGWEPNVALSLFTLVKDPLKSDWIPQMEYFPGESVIHQGKQYQCVIGHTSQTDWAPGKCGLWK